MIDELTQEPQFLCEANHAVTRTINTSATSETLSNQSKESVYPLPFGKLYVEYYTEDWMEPDWLLPTFNTFQKLCDLEPNWDSYGALKIDTKSLEAALIFLIDFLPINAPTPAIVPTPSGNIQIEWHERKIDFEIEIRPHGVHDYYFHDIQKNVEVEKEFTGNFAPLREHIETLVGRS